ncbi:class I SAM-dependent DNA methyltransferase [Aliiroseovarius sp. YM-037]|uniref:class I SAM-dependent DNA methyltransferase n=1 Tax=Aliiroseovarius sp. YM-037 TaxID=3341728 RepID=UPI003A80159E
MGKSFLSKAYELFTSADTRKLYDDWSESYDAEIAENGYQTPDRIADALRQFADRDTVILDFGCGTGLSGEALKAAGFTMIDGVDLSADMLAEAKAKGVYRDLQQVEAGDDLSTHQGKYGAVTACGAIGVGAAPIEVVDVLMNLLDKDGLFVFSLNDHALADPVFEAKVMEYTDCGAARLEFREHGDHLPGINLKSMVYVLRKN